MSKSCIDIAPATLVSERSDLVRQWEQVFGRPPATNLPEHLLCAGVAYEHQAREHGRLRRRVRDDLVRFIASPTKQPTRRPRSGAQIVREWNGVTHLVEVVSGGFLYRGRPYNSLTAIAFEITGARWSGPRFFGLKSRTGHGG